MVLDLAPPVGEKKNIFRAKVWLGEPAPTSSMGAGSISSCSFSSAAASSAPTRSARDASACPNLTYVGPNFSTASTTASKSFRLYIHPILANAPVTEAARDASCPGWSLKYWSINFGS